MSDFGFGPQDQIVPGLANSGVTGPAGDPSSPQPTVDPSDPSNATFANVDAGDTSSEVTPVDTGDATFVGAEPAANPDVIPIAGDSAEDPNLGEPGDPAGVDTGDATFVGADTDPKPDVIPVNGDSSTPPPETSDPPDYVSPLFGARAKLNAYDFADEDGPDPWKGFPGHDDDTKRMTNPVAPSLAKSDASGQLPWLAAAGVVGVVLLGAVGFAATRGPSPAPVPTTAATASVAAPTLAPTASVARTTAATVAPVAARVTDTKVAEQGNVCLNPTIMTAVAKIDGAKAGDTVVFRLSGPGLPATVSGQLDASGSVSAVMGTVGPVKGTQSWSAAVQSIAGKDVVSGPSQVFGFCPNG